MRNYVELLVFRGGVSDTTVAGLLQITPHTTIRDVRMMLRSQLGFASAESAVDVEDLILSRCTFDRASSNDAAPQPNQLPKSDAGSGGAAADVAAANGPSSSSSCSAGGNGSASSPPPRVAQMAAMVDAVPIPIPRTQNHKLVYPLFPLEKHVLLVEEPTGPHHSSDVVEAVKARALRGERTLMTDVSRGHERAPIPVFNGADDDGAPNDFTYVTECVVNEGLRLLLGGPLRDTWTCPYLSGTHPRKDFAYTENGLFLHRPHTIDSVYECTIASGCGIECKNRLVQRGPKFRLEVIKCMQRDGKFVKGWGVRSPDFIPCGSFVCEYIGEYISDDEAESRGIRYDNQKMSRLMDVYGDGKDTVRMCIDATKFSNLGRFLNHSCDPNCFKQRVFCDHDSRLPRVAFFALRDIPQYEELAYDYGYADVPGKTMPCLCGADKCKKLLY